MSVITKTDIGSGHNVYFVKKKKIYYVKYT